MECASDHELADDQALERLRPGLAWIVGALLRSCDVKHQRERLQLVRKLLLPFRAHVVFNGTSCFGSVEHYLAVSSATLEDFDEADARFHAASVAHATMTAPALLALTKLEWAKMLLRRRAPSDSVRGRVLLEETLTIAHGLGLTGLENESHRLLAAESQTSQAT